VCRRASGAVPAPRTRSNGCTRSSSEGSKLKPYCRPPTPQQCCSGHCWPLARPTCARLMAGRRSPLSLSISRLTWSLEAIRSCYRRSRHQIPTAFRTAPWGTAGGHSHDQNRIVCCHLLSAAPAWYLLRKRGWASSGSVQTCGSVLEDGGRSEGEKGG